MRASSLAAASILTIASSACGSEMQPPEEPADPCANQMVGTACTWLGIKAETGFTDDGLPRYETKVNEVQDLVFLDDGTAIYSDLNNHVVRRINTDQTVETLVGTIDPIFPGDGPIGGIPAEGALGTEWRLTHPTGLLLQPDRNVLLAAWHNFKVLQIDLDSGWVTVVSGAEDGFSGDGGPARDGRFKRPNDLASDEQGNIYIIDQQNQRIRRIDPAGIIDTIAGTGTMGYSGDGGPAVEAELSFADTSSPNPSGNLVYLDRKLYVSDTEANRVRIIDLDSGIIDLLAGTGEAGYSGDDGPALQAMLSAPRGLEIGPDGDLYFADTDNGAVRAIDLSSGTIRTVAGTGELGLNEEEQLPATETHLRRPFGVSFDPDGNMYVMDSLNERIVRVLR